MKNRKIDNQDKVPGWLGGYEEMAAYAGCSKRTICRWISERKLKVRHLSARKVLCLPRDIDRCIETESDAYEMAVQS